MIGRIRGVLLEKQAPDIVVDVQGVGYELQVPMSTIYQLPAPGQQVQLFTHLVVREDAQLLYGFHELRERLLFRHLIRISGVGPKMALAILSGMAVDDFIRTVNNNDVSAMVRMPGIGRKTAERLIVEMRDKLESWEEAQGSVGAGGGSEPLPAVESQRKMSADAETALIALGYKPQEAARVVMQVLKQHDDLASSEELIRLALRSLA
ncbi:MAG: Holliday junction branch migration protein RuvA [Pseudomonadales bacterium]|nr:Holliday junction branch migration protein RuvA [Pseudomonadales bacterium]